MRLLLDSNVFVFVVQQPDRIPARAHAAIIDPANTRLLSVVTPWELQIKASLQKFKFDKPLVDIVHRELETRTLELLPITLEHIDVLSRLPNHHRDPFDRLLIAQAIHEGLTLITSDKTIAQYAAPVLWE
ncbi:MAG TPA: type II toxin-antitoxin system VapC family toxin [Tepidisphaeraceae bacterium]|nr:type II toxin-antitoxin system VapC family toxin [Tepidisphaeraceae bacterium]